MDANRIKKYAGAAIAISLLSAGARLSAQDTQSTTHVSGQPAVETDVRRGEVVYVSGNDLVIRMSTGEVKHFTVPPDFRFNVDGQDLAVQDLKPGMHLSRTITTTTTPRTVKTVRTINGKVWHVNPPKTVILTLGDGTNKQYNVPDGQKFMIDGQEQTVFQLRKGMNVSATVVTESPETVVSTSQSGVTGTAPPPPPGPPPQTPAMVGVLLIESAPAATEAPKTAAAATPATLPKTATRMPLIGLVGLVALMLFLIVRTARRPGI
jgi:hypothetical protein